MPATTEAQLVGTVKDISDVLAIANAAEMPFMSMIKKGARPKNTLMEYDIDKYDTAKTTGVPDGSDVDTFEDAQVNRAPLYARVQKWRRAPMVTDMAENVTVQEVDHGSKFNEAKAKKTIELKQDMEATVLGDQDSSPQLNAKVGAVTRGMGAWTQTGAQVDQPVDARYRPSAGQIYTGVTANFYEANLRAMLQARYETVKAFGNLKGFLGTNVKNQITDFSRFETVAGAQVAVRRFNTEGKTQTPINILTAVDMYKGDFGVVELFLDLFLPDMNHGHFIDMNMVEVRMTTNPMYRDLPDLDGGPRGVVKAIGGLANRNPQTHCKIAGQ